MEGWFCCYPGLHHIVNFVKTEKHSKLEKKGEKTGTYNHIFQCLVKVYLSLHQVESRLTTAQSTTTFYNQILSTKMKKK